MKKLRNFDLLSFYNKRKLCESALQSLGYHHKRLPRTADPDYGHSLLDSSEDADAQAYDAQINALMDGGTPLLSGTPPSSSGATSASLSGGYSSCSAAPPSAKAMPRTSTSVTRPCPTPAQGEQANEMRETEGCHAGCLSDDAYALQLQQLVSSVPANFTASLSESM